MFNFLFGLIAGSGLTWVFISLRRDRYWHEYTTRHCQGGEITRAEWEAMRTPRRGSNPPPPGTKPQPPSGPPQPLAAQLIRYWTWENDQIRQAFNEGRTTRGNGNGTVCQVCWEAQSSCLWWAMVQLLPEEGTHA